MDVLEANIHSSEEKASLSSNLNLNEFIIDMGENPEEILPELALDGERHRFGRNNHGWYIGNNEILTIGSWKNSSKKTFRFTSRKMSEGERAEYNSKLERKRIEDEKLCIEEKKKTTQKTVEMFNSGEDALSLYLSKKSLSSNHGARTYRNGRILLVPIYDNSGFHSLQIIDSENSSRKRFLNGTQKKGSYYLLDSSLDSYISRIKSANEIYLAEGFATGASIKTAFLDVEVAVAFDSGNLVSAIESLRALNNKLKIVICSDRDYISQTGVLRSQEIIEHIRNTEYVIPEFIEEDNHLSDFNDLHVNYGLSAVRVQIETNHRFKSWRN